MLLIQCIHTSFAITCLHISTHSAMRRFCTRSSITCSVQPPAICCDAHLTVSPCNVPALAAVLQRDTTNPLFSSFGRCQRSKASKHIRPIVGRLFCDSSGSPCERCASRLAPVASGVLSTHAISSIAIPVEHQTITRRAWHCVIPAHVHWCCCEQTGITRHACTTAQS